MGEPAAIQTDIAEAFDFLFDPPLGEVRYRVAYGGRYGAKSWSFARALLLHGACQPLRALCTREFQTSVRDSVHRLLSDQIHELGLDAHYTVERSRIYGANGTEFFFLGLKRNPHAIKSLEGVNICWVEEAEAVTDESWRILIPTIRAEGSEIWVTFNPAQADDPTFKRFIATERDDAIVRKVTWEDNPWITEAIRDEERWLRVHDPEAHAHVWGGEPWMRSEAQVLSGMYEVDDFTPESHWDGPYFGADWGFARDPTVLVKLWIADKRLWIEEEQRGIGWSMDEIDRRFRRIDDADKYVIRGDAARPETIHELQRRGLRVEAAAKWPGSVEEGVEHLRGYDKIMIHSRCKGLIQEARLWRYKTDARTGDVLPKLQDGNDHGWDAVRYALAPMIRKRPRLEVLA